MYGVTLSLSKGDEGWYKMFVMVRQAHHDKDVTLSLSKGAVAGM